MNNSKIPGAVIEVKIRDEVVMKQAYGYAQKYDYNHHRLALPDSMTVGTLFDIASLTKVVGTITAIMLLVDRGLVHLDDPVSKYIAAFGSPDKASITIRHLLTHTAGLYEWYPMYYRASNKEETFKLIGGLPLAFKVGAGRHYSDLGFTVLGEIIEKFRDSLDQFEAQNIFVPLGMAHTLYNRLVPANALILPRRRSVTPMRKAWCMTVRPGSSSRRSNMASGTAGATMYCAAK